MIDMDFSFEESPWERYVRQLEEGDTVSGSYFLTLMEGENEDTLEEAFLALEDLTVTLDLTDLPAPVYSGELGTILRQEMELAKNGMDPSALEETDPLRLYLEELAAIPVAGDICLLAEELGLANREGKASDRLRNAIVNLSLSRVAELAAAFSGKGMLLMDLIQEGSIGLWRCTESWSGKGVDFEMIRDWWIRFYMSKAVLTQARASGVGQKMRAALEDYRAADERLLADLGRNPTLEEIAEQLHMTVEGALVVKNMLDNARILASSRKQPEPEEEQEEENQAVEDTALFQMRQRILDLLSGLDAEDQKLLTLRFGLEGGKPLSPEETGRKLGLTAREVVAREAAALAKLRNK